jgi:hypothetical protein
MTSSFETTIGNRFGEPFSVYYISSLFRTEPFTPTLRFHVLETIFEKERKKWENKYSLTCKFVDIQGKRSQWLFFLKNLVTEKVENFHQDDFLLYWNTSFTLDEALLSQLRKWRMMRMMKDEKKKEYPLKLFYDRCGVPIGCYIPHMIIQYVSDWWIKCINHFDFTNGWKKMEKVFPDFTAEYEIKSKNTLSKEINLRNLQLSDFVADLAVTTVDEKLLLGTFVVIMWDTKNLVDYIVYLKETLGIDITSSTSPSSSYQNHFIFPRNNKMTVSLFRQFLEEYDSQIMCSTEAWKIRSKSSQKLKTVNLSNQNSPYIDDLWRKYLLREALRFFEQDVKVHRFSFLLQGTILSKDFFQRVKNSSSSFISHTSTELMLEAKILLEDTSVKKQVIRSSCFISKGDLRDLPCFMSCGTQYIPKLLSSIMFGDVFFHLLETEVPVASFAPQLFIKSRSDFQSLNKSLLFRTPLHILDSSFVFPKRVLLPSIENKTTLHKKPHVSKPDASIGTVAVSCVKFISCQRNHSLPENVLMSHWKSVPRHEFIYADENYQDICEKFRVLQNDGTSHKMANQALRLQESSLEIRKILLKLMVAIGWGGTIVDGDTLWRPHIRWQSISSQTQGGEKAIIFQTNDPDSFHPCPFLRSVFVTEAWQPFFCNVFFAFVNYLESKYNNPQTNCYLEDFEESDHIREDVLKLDCFMHCFLSEEVLVLPTEVSCDKSLYSDQNFYTGGAYLGRPMKLPFVLEPSEGFSTVKEVKVVILTKNNNDYFEHFFYPKMQQVEKRFPTILFRYYIFENGSTDGTLSTIQRNASSQTFKTRMTIYTCKEMNLSESDMTNLDSLERSHRIGILRNMVANKMALEEQEEIESHGVAKTWVLLLDTNILFNCNTIHQILIDGIQYSGTHAAVCANTEELQSGIFYDTLSYNYGEYFYRRDEFCKMMSKSRDSPESSLLHNVETAFGGMMLLRQTLFYSCRWGQYPATLRSSSTSLSCEHYHFCRMLKTYGNIGISLNTKGLYIENWQTEMKKNWLAPYLTQLVQVA